MKKIKFSEKENWGFLISQAYRSILKWLPV